MEGLGHHWQKWFKKIFNYEHVDLWKNRKIRLNKKWPK